MEEYPRLIELAKKRAAKEAMSEAELDELARLLALWNLENTDTHSLREFFYESRRDSMLADPEGDMDGEVEMLLEQED